MESDIEMMRKSSLLALPLICLLWQTVAAHQGIPGTNAERKSRFISFDSNSGRIDVSVIYVLQNYIELIR